MNTQPHNDSKSLIQSYGPCNDISLPLKCKWAWNHPLTICPITCKANPLICTHLSLEAPSHFPYWDYFFPVILRWFQQTAIFLNTPAQRENTLPLHRLQWTCSKAKSPVFMRHYDPFLSCKPMRTWFYIPWPKLIRSRPNTLRWDIYYPRHINFLRSLFRAVGMQFMRQLS